MKRFILALLLAAIASPAMSQTLDDYEYLGYKQALMTCKYLRSGINDRNELTRMIGILLSPSARQKYAVISSESEKYGYNSQVVRSYLKGFWDQITPCKDAYTKLYPSK
jgi:hypothetical protein